MRVGVVVAFAVASAGAAAPLACVDLFHATDYETLCVREPTSAACASDAAADDGAGTDARQGGKPLVDFCRWSAGEARSQAERACAWLGACSGPLGNTVFGPCVMHALWAYDCAWNPTMRPQGGAYALWSCLSDVKSCGDVDACLFPEGVPSCAAVSGGSFSACALGAAATVRLECGRPQQGPPIGVEPCALAGKTCTRLDDSTGLCTGAKQKDCSAGKRCVGAAAVDCSAVGTVLVDRGIDCALSGGGACVADDAGLACAPQDDAGACEGGLSITCDGARARSCVGGKQIAIDCARVGLPCDVTNTPVPTLEPLRACTNHDAGTRCAAADECVGDTLRSCAQGARFSVDCAKVGLGRCEKLSGVLARCAPPP